VAIGKAYISRRFRLSPLSLSCPYCKAKRGQRCSEDGGALSNSHEERSQMASLADRMGALRSRAERRAHRSNGSKMS
jgi:hypothetical protein